MSRKKSFGSKNSPNKALPPDGTVAVNPTMYVPGTGLSYSLRGES